MKELIILKKFMISSEVDKFYRKVIKDFVANLGRNQYLLRELEQNHIYLNQIEQKLFQKMKNPSNLFKRLTNGYNEIEKEMFSHYAVSEDMPHTQRQHIINSISKSLREEESSPHSFSNDLELIANHNSSEPILKNQQVKQQEIANLSESDPEDAPLKRKASLLSLQEMSSISQENSQVFRNLRQNVKIHILGTYDLQSKKHSFKMDKTQVRLQNVIIKAQGVAKQIFLKSLTCTSRKRVHL